MGITLSENCFLKLIIFILGHNVAEILCKPGQLVQKVLVVHADVFWSVIGRAVMHVKVFFSVDMNSAFLVKLL